MLSYINYIKESKQSWKKQVDDAYIEYEKTFLELIHLDELEIKFDIIEHKDYIIYIIQDKEYFVQDKKNRYFYIDYNNIWSFFQSKYKLNKNEIQYIIIRIIDNYLKLNNYKIEIKWVTNTIIND